jgi:hypothetical protein
VRLIGVLSVGLILAACPSGWRRLEKPPRSVLWVSSGAELDFADLASLEAVGVGELFVEAAGLDWPTSRPRLEPLLTLELPRRTGVTLVVAGTWPAAELHPRATAKALAEGLTTLAAAAQARGLEPLGFHFDVDAGGSLDSYASTLSALQSELAGPLFLSATVPRGWLGDPGLDRLAGAVDFLVAFVYGQRPGELEEPTAWDLLQVEADLKRLAELGRDYLVAVVTVGRAVHLGGRGQVLAETTRLPLRDLVRRPELELASGFTLQGIDRLVYTFQAKAPLRLGDWQLRRGEAVRVAGLAGYHVEEAQRRVSALALDGNLGFAYYRLGSREEPLALSTERLLAALATDSATAAAPEVRLLEEEASSTGLLFQVVLDNRSSEPTEVIPLSANYVELQAEGGTFGSVEPGQFLRWELLRANPRGELERSYREATVLRLYAPFLDGGESLASGRVEVIGRGATPTVGIGGAFVVPGGRRVPVVAAPPPPEPTPPTP